MPRLPRSLAAPLVALLSVLLAGVTMGAPAAHADNVATPGNFTGYGFDQCLAPAQSTMDRWLDNSPFLAVGIYVSGDSRGCRNQPNLTPTWVATQLQKGWRLLPITLGPQASCSTKFPRYGTDKTINPTKGSYAGFGRYGRAQAQGNAQASRSVADAAALGISAGSALWYDLEAFNTSQTSCRESALYFVSAWTAKVRSLGYRTGLYSSAGSGIMVLDQARAANRSFSYPDYIWMARWDRVPNTRSTYVSDEGWNPHSRVKQYLGGHNETWGGVTINIDRNYLDLGKGTIAPADVVHCGGVRIDHTTYNRLAASVNRPRKTRALQCLLREKGVYAGRLTGVYDAATAKAANTWQQKVGATRTTSWSTDNWATLLSAGPTPVLKVGSGSHAVRRLQRALNAGLPTARLSVTGVFDAATAGALRSWQDQVGLPVTGIAAANTWAALQR